MINTEWDPMMATITLNEVPIKLVEGAVPVSLEEAHTNLEAAKNGLIDVSPDAYGTCVDERPRVGLSNGEAVVEPRESVEGGPNIHATYVAELSGYFPADSNLSGDDRLKTVTGIINKAGIKSGGHKKCAAAKIGEVLEVISNNKDAVYGYAADNIGDEFDHSAMDEVFTNAERAVANKTYEGFSEANLIAALGDEAGEAIEELADVEHKGSLFARNQIPGKTVHQSTLDNTTFAFDDPYADRIERALATGPDPERMAVVMRHAREAVLAGVANAVPNPVLYQGKIS